MNIELTQHHLEKDRLFPIAVQCNYYDQSSNYIHEAFYSVSSLLIYLSTLAPIHYFNSYHYVENLIFSSVSPLNLFIFNIAWTILPGLYISLTDFRISLPICKHTHTHIHAIQELLGVWSSLLTPWINLGYIFVIKNLIHEHDISLHLLGSLKSVYNFCWVTVFVFDLFLTIRCWVLCKNVQNFIFYQFVAHI